MVDSLYVTELDICFSLSLSLSISLSIYLSLSLFLYSIYYLVRFNLISNAVRTVALCWDSTTFNCTDVEPNTEKKKKIDWDISWKVRSGVHFVDIKIRSWCNISKSPKNKASPLDISMLCSTGREKCDLGIVHGDQKVPVYLIITLQKAL
jgi:hypothetical protein